MEIKILIRHSQSLKDKRKIIKSLKQKIKNSFNVSISEDAYLNDYKLAKLNLVIIASSKVIIDKEFAKLEKLLYLNGNFEIIDLNFYQIM